MAKDVVIVTGACGRIGTALVHRLGEKYAIAGCELEHAIYASKKEELIPVDLTSDASVAQAFRHIREYYGGRIISCIHLAAYYSFAEKESPLYEKVTVRGTERLLRALQGFEVEQFIFTSTMLVHAPSKPGVPIREDSPISPSWPYPRSKVETEELIHQIRGKIPTVVLRIAGVYDDLCHSIPISHQIQRIYEKQFNAHFFAGNLEHGASFLHMDDLVDAIVSAVEKRKELPGETSLLLGEPKTLSYDALQKKISLLLYGSEIHTYSLPKWFAKLGAVLQCAFSFRHKPFIRPWMIDIADDHYELDIQKARTLLGWEPHRDLSTSLAQMIEKLIKNPKDWYRENHL
ncbi:MAG: NAD(P)-dependent oxidoreductase [Verrucomicrobiota bacterium]|nr:NAD(P)-dependent oxidoreductase [Verrucomicrobiota bacterium]